MTNKISTLTASFLSFAYAISRQKNVIVRVQELQIKEGELYEFIEYDTISNGKHVFVI